MPSQPEADPESVARDVVLRRLAMRAHTRAELQQALAKRDIPSEVSERVLNRMEQVGLVNDESFADDWVASRQQRRHLSRRGLRSELTRKGVDPEVISSALAEVDDEAEFEAALALVERKKASYARLDDTVRTRRLMGLLARRGFSGAVAARVLENIRFEDSG